MLDYLPRRGDTCSQGEGFKVPHGATFEDVFLCGTSAIFMQRNVHFNLPCNHSSRITQTPIELAVLWNCKLISVRGVDAFDRSKDLRTLSDIRSWERVCCQNGGSPLFVASEGPSTCIIVLLISGKNCPCRKGDVCMKIQTTSRQAVAACC